MGRGVGPAWGGEFQNTTNPGWLSDVGFGLRILSCRSAFGNVLHADIAFPLNGDTDIRSVQFLLRSKATFNFCQFPARSLPSFQ